MTKCERTYELAHPLDEALLKQISVMHGIIGIQKLRPSANLDAITVGWDAARMSIPQLESLLAQNGFPLKPYVPPPPPVRPQPAPAEVKA